MMRSVFLLVALAFFVSADASTSASRTHNHILTNEISVKSYGATGNGVTDDTAAIMSATAALVATAQPNQPNILLFSRGTYLISTPLSNSQSAYINLPVSVNTTFTLQGEDDSSEIIFNPNNGILIAALDSDGGGREIPQGSSITLTQLSITASATVLVPAPSGQNYMFNSAVENVQINDVNYNGAGSTQYYTVYSARGTGDLTSTFTINSSQGSNDSTFLQLTDIGRVSITYISLDGFVDSIVWQSQYPQLASDSETCNLLIQNAEILNYGTAISINGVQGGQTPVDVSITNTTLNCGTGLSGSLICRYGMKLFWTSGTFNFMNADSVDPTSDVVHLNVGSSSSTIQLSKAQFSGGEYVYQSQNSTSALEINYCLFAGSMSQGSIWIVSPDAQVNIAYNQCQGSNTQIHAQPSNQCNSTSSSCFVAYNSGC